MGQKLIWKREREVRAQAGLKEVSTEAYLEFQEFLEQGRKSQNFKTPKGNNYNGSGGGAYTFRATESTGSHNKSTMQTQRSKNNNNRK